MNEGFEEIFYSREYQVATKNPVERFLFMQWVLDIVCLTQALYEKHEQNNGYDRWYQQLFYIKLVGLFDVLQNDTSINESNDEYILRVKYCVSQIYNLITDDEYIYIVYRRVSSAHPFQNKYDLYNILGDKINGSFEKHIRGQKKMLSREDINKAINRVLDACNNREKLYDIKIVNVLYPYIMPLRDKLMDNLNSSILFF